MPISEKEKIKFCAQKLLARREHSRQELKNKLRLRKFSMDLIEEVLQECEEHNWQNNERFTEMYIRSKVNRGFGLVKIKCDLKERGVDDSLIIQIDEFTEEHWQDSISRLWQKKYGSCSAKQVIPREKQMRFFLSRGFTLDQIRKFFNSMDGSSSPFDKGGMRGIL